MKLFGSTKKLVDNTKNGENVPSLDMAEVVLVQSRLVGNQYQQKCEALYIFTPDTSYAYLFNAELTNLVFSKVCNTDFDIS